MKLHTKLLSLVLAAALLLCLPTALRRIEEQIYPCRYASVVEGYAAAYEMDPLLIYTFVRTESGFDPEAVSSVGARGLMQMTEETFEWIKTKIAPDEPLTFDDLFDPACAPRGLHRRRQDPALLPLQPHEPLRGEDPPLLQTLYGALRPQYIKEKEALRLRNRKG